MATRTYLFLPSYFGEESGSDQAVDFIMTQPSFDAIIARIDALDEKATGSIDRIARAVEKQNGRITTIEHERLLERGARDAVAKAAADTAAALERAKTLREKSRRWKIGVVTAILGSLGGIVTVGALVAHVIVRIL